jgi:hypothetical protein
MGIIQETDLTIYLINNIRYEIKKAYTLHRVGFLIIES